jgi:hypothetical protein
MKLAILLCLLMTGCATATIKTTTSEGKLCEASYTSVLKDVGEAGMSACGGKGGVVNSKVNTALMEALIKAALAGAAL